MKSKITYKSSPKLRAAIHLAFDLLKTDEYFREYYRILQNIDSDSIRNRPVDAWKELENDLFELCGQNRYDDYDTFRNKRYLYCKRVMRYRK